MASPLRISVFDSKILQATILAIRAANKDLQGEIRRFTKSELAPEWQAGLASRASTALESRVLVDTARVTVSNQNITLKSASVGKSLSGGLQPKLDYAPVAFGADPAKVAAYETHSKRGKPYRVTRHTQRQFKPAIKSGYVVYPTAANIIPRLASLWVQTAIRTIMDGVDRKDN